MTWTVADFAHANHNPVAVVNGQSGTAPLEMDVRVGQTITLDAGQSSDPDRTDSCTFTGSTTPRQGLRTGIWRR